MLHQHATEVEDWLRREIGDREARAYRDLLNGAENPIEESIDFLVALDKRIKAHPQRYARTFAALKKRASLLLSWPMVGFILALTMVITTSVFFDRPRLFHQLLADFFPGTPLPPSSSEGLGKPDQSGDRAHGGSPSEAPQERGVRVTLRGSHPEAPTHEVELYRSSFALVIGIDAYTGGWTRLSNAVEDAKLVARALSQQGFVVSLECDLDATALEKTLKAFFIEKGEDPEARLFVWFAGHGHTDAGEGYLVPADAPQPTARRQFLIKALPIRRFGEYVRQAQSKHVLSVFDACFAGTIFDVQRSMPSAAVTLATTRPVRQFVTSGDANQEVSDNGTFRKLFVDSLCAREGADGNGDGYLTASELGMFLTDRVTNLTEGKQTPRSGKLRDRGFDRGDFVFVLPPEPCLEPSGGSDAP